MFRVKVFGYIPKDVVYDCLKSIFSEDIALMENTHVDERIAYQIGRRWTHSFLWNEQDKEYFKHLMEGYLEILTTKIRPEITMFIWRYAMLHLNDRSKTFMFNSKAISRHIKGNPEVYTPKLPEEEDPFVEKYKEIEMEFEKSAVEIVIG